MKVSGTVRVGEAAPVAAKAIRPLTGEPRLFAWAVVGAVVGGAAGAALMLTVRPGSALLQSLLGWSTFVGTFGGMWVGIEIARRAALRRFGRALKARGGSDVVDLEVVLSEAALIQTTAGLEQRAPWPIVSDLFPVPGYWVFLASGSPLYVPVRCFADPAAEAAFLERALSYMDEGARCRSAAASDFVARARQAQNATA